MPSFSSNAIGFYLQVADTLSPSLVKAEKNYGKFVKKLDAWNTKAFQSASRGFAGVAKAMMSGTKGSAIGGRSSMKVSVEFSKASTKALGMSVARAVATALRKASFGGKKGSITIPRFAKGGLVGKGAGPKVDDQLAMLAKGERILSSADYKSIEDQLGQFRDAAGKFAKVPAEMASAHKAFDGLAASMGDLADAYEVGLAPDAPAKYAVQMKKLVAVQKVFFAQVQGASPAMQKKLVPALKAVNAQVVALQQNALKSQSPWETLLTKVLGPVRFIAISEAMKNIGENFRDISAAADHATSAFNLDKAADGLITNFQQMNAVWHLSGDELDQLRDDFVAMNQTLRLGVRDLAGLSEATQQLAKAGVGKDLALGLTQGVYLLSKASGVTTDSLVHLSTVMTKDLHMSAEDVTGSFATLGEKAKVAGVDAQVLVDAMQEVTASNRAFFAGMSGAEAKTASASMASLIAAASAVDTDIGKAMAHMLDGLADPANFAKLLAVFVDGEAGLKEALTSGDLSTVFQSFATMTDTQMTKAAEAFNIPVPLMAKLATNADQLNTTTHKLGKTFIANADASKHMEDQIWSTKTTFQKLRDTLEHAVTNTFPGVIQFFKDLNPLAILSTGYLLKEFKVFSLLSKLKMPSLGKAAGSVVLPKLGADAAGAASATPVLSKLGSVLSKILVPLTAVWSAIVGIGTAIGTALIGPLTVASGLIAAAVIAFLALVGVVVYFRKEIGAFLRGTWAGFLEGMRPVTDTLAPAFEAFGAVVKWLTDTVLFALNYWIDKFSNGSGATEKSLEGCTSAGISFGKAIAWVMKVALLPITGTIKLITYLIEQWPAIWAGIGTVWGTVTGAIADGVLWLWGKFTDFMGFLAELPAKLGEVFALVPTIIQDAFGSAIDWVTAKFTDLFGWFGKKWESFKGLIGLGAAVPAAPTDLTGGNFKGPGMASGGFVTGGSGHKIDDVLAMLAKGEMVVPAATTARLSEQATNPIASYPMMNRDAVNSVSTPGMSGDSRAVEVLDAILVVMKSQLEATRSNASVSSYPGRAGGSALGRKMATGGV